MKDPQIWADISLCDKDIFQISMRESCSTLEEMSPWFASLKETEDGGEYAGRRQSASPKQNSKKTLFLFLCPQTGDLWLMLHISTH